MVTGLQNGDPTTFGSDILTNSYHSKGGKTYINADNYVS